MFKRIAAISLVVLLSVAVGIAIRHYAPRLLLPEVEVISTARFIERTTQFEILVSPAANVMIGDSITERGMWSEMFVGRSVANRGVGSLTTLDIIEHLPSLPQGARRAFVMAGINDIAEGRKTAEIADTYRTLVGQLRARGLDVVVQSTLLTANSAYNTEVNTLNALLRNYCSEGSCTYVDLATALSTEGRLTPAVTVDGVHITGPGYKAWATLIEPLLL